MSVIRDPYATIALDGGLPQKILGGRITIDRSWSPYIQGSVTVERGTIPDITVYGPTSSGVTAVVRMVQQYRPDRVINLFVRGVDVDYKANTMTLKLASGEALMQRALRLTPFRTANPITSLISACNSALNFTFQHLTLGTRPVVSGFPPDSYFDIAWKFTNRVTYPSLSSLSAVANLSNATDIALATSSPWQGPEYVRFEAAAAGWARLRIVGEEQCAPGDNFYGGIYCRNGAAGRNMRAELIFRNSNGKAIKQVYGGSIVAPTGTAWALAEVWGEAPSGTASVQFVVAGQATAAGNAFAVDGAIYGNNDSGFGPGIGTIPWFSGSGSPFPFGYTFAWDDEDPPGSSTRYPITEFHPSVLMWDVGETAWDWLEPLLTLAGRRLICDENGTWKLLPDAPPPLDIFYAVPSNVTQASAGLDIDDASVAPTAVAVCYRWTSTRGVSADRYDRTQWDYAGTGPRGKIVYIDRPYPGPGAAAKILASLQARTTTPGTITLDLDISVKPLMGLDIDWDGFYRIDAVTFDLSTWLMELTPRST